MIANDIVVKDNDESTTDDTPSTVHTVNTMEEFTKDGTILTEPY